MRGGQCKNSTCVYKECQPFSAAKQESLSTNRPSLRVSILLPCMQSARDARPDFFPGVNLFIYRSAQNSAAAQSTFIKCARRREES